MKRIAIALACALFVTISALAADNDTIVKGAAVSSGRLSLMYDIGKYIRNLIRPETGAAGLALIGLFSAAYGILHSVGPGHQKTLVAGILLSDGGKAKSAAAAAGIAAGSHAASVILVAVLLTLITGTLSIHDAQKATRYISILSGWLLAAIALWIVYKRIRAAFRRHGTRQDEAHEHDCACGHCACGGHQHEAHEHSARRFIPVFAGSFVPCPGAMVFMLYGFSAGNIAASFLSVAAMSLGMWLTLFCVGMLALWARRAGMQRSSRSSRGLAITRTAFELGGALLVLFFAAALVLTGFMQ